MFSLISGSIENKEENRKQVKDFHMLQGQCKLKKCLVS